MRTLTCACDMESAVPAGLYSSFAAFPALTCWATECRPCGTLPAWHLSGRPEGLLHPKQGQPYFLMAIPRSFNCASLTDVGASTIRSLAAAVLGKGITS